MDDIYGKVVQCLSQIKSGSKLADFRPEVAVVLGSGLGGFADRIDVIEELPYSDIIGFPLSTVPGHEGKFYFGYLGKTPIVCMKGRVHYYEGYPMSDVVLGVRIMGLMGAQTLYLTNAAGGVNKLLAPGDIMLITDQIACFVPNPLIGPNIEQLGPRFPDMTNLYDKELRQTVRFRANRLGIPLREGVYMQLSGPSYESAAEVRMARTLGADAVAMSTAVEAIAARHMGMRVCGFSCICNMAVEDGAEPLSHELVQKVANENGEKMSKLLYSCIETE